MPSIDAVRDWQGRTMLDHGGERIGRIQEIYLDMQTDEPEWALVNTGLFGMRSSFVPIKDATTSGDDVVVPFSKDQVKGAPGIEPDGELSEAEEEELYRHYGVEPLGGGTPAAGPKTQAGRRLRRWIVTEYEAPPGPDGSERVVVEREPLGDDADPGTVR